MKRNVTKTGPEMDREPLGRLLEAYGSQLERWPDAACAAEARQRLVSDQPFRAAWESERSLDRGLAALRTELDEAAMRDDAAGRVSAGVVARLPRPLDGISWRSLAAAMMLAAFLGGAFQALRPPTHAEAASLVLLDPTLPEIEELRF